MSLKHTTMFKAQILSLKQSGHTASALCRRYNLGHSTISRWEKEFKKAHSDSEATHQLPSESQHKARLIEELETDVENLKEEIDILKAAVSLLCKKKELK